MNPVQTSKNDTRFKPGNKAHLGGTNRGGNRFSGRSLVLHALDAVLARKKNIKAFKDAMQAEIDKDPMTFFRNTIVPLLPPGAVGNPENGESKVALRISFEPKEALPVLDAAAGGK